MWVSCINIKKLAPLLCIFVFWASKTLQFPLLYHHRSHHQRFPCRGSKWIKWWVCWENVETAALDIRAHHSYDLSSTFIPLYDFGCTISVMFDVAVKRRLDAFIKAYFQLPQPLRQTFKQGLTRGGAGGALSKIHSSWNTYAGSWISFKSLNLGIMVVAEMVVSVWTKVEMLKA